VIASQFLCTSKSVERLSGLSNRSMSHRYNDAHYAGKRINFKAVDSAKISHSEGKTSHPGDQKWEA